jgi:hypothetical protein
MKTKKIVVAVLMAVLLISAALIAGCTNPLEIIPAKQDKDDYVNYQIPAGKGVVKFKFSDSKPRTILPDKSSSGLEVSDMLFDVKFTTNPGGVVSYFPCDDDDGSAGTPIRATKASYSEVTAPIIIGDEDYDFVITAYDSTGLIPIAGYTSAAPINVDTGTTTNVGSIDLIGFVNGDYKGFLSYNITVPVITGGYDTCELEILKADRSTSVDVITLTEDNVANDDPAYALDSGYYYVVVTVAKAKYITRQYTEALHIYPAMTSKMPAFTVDTLVQNKFDVSFSLNGRAVTDVDYLTINSGKTQILSYGQYADIPSIPPVATDPDYVFKGWFISDSPAPSASPFAFNTTRIMTDYSPLYAKWAQNTWLELDLAIPEYATPIPGKTLYLGVFGSTTYFDGLNSVTLTLAPPEPGENWDTGTIIWTTGNGTIDAALLISHANNTTLTISNDNLDIFAVNDLLVPSVYPLNISVTAEYNGTAYSASTTVTIVEANSGP